MTTLTALTADDVAHWQSWGGRTETCEEWLDAGALRGVQPSLAIAPLFAGQPIRITENATDGEVAAIRCAGAAAMRATVGF
jgi:Flp pilus assembly protein CpaB